MGRIRKGSARPRSILNEPLLTKGNVCLFLIVASVYFFTFNLRMYFSSELAYIDVPYYLFLALMLVSFRGRSSAAGFAFWAVTSAVFLVTELSVGTGWKDVLKFFFLYCAPLLVCQLWFGRTHEERVGFAQTIIRVVNFFALIVFGILVVDCLTGSAVMRILTSTVLKDMASWVPSSISERHPSIWGHYLITAGFYMAFYFMNVAYENVEGEWLIDVRLLYVVATIGVLSTGGKTALVIYFVAIIWLNVTGPHGLRNAVALTAFLALLYWLGLFDIVLSRFEADDLSSGRNEAAEALLRFEAPAFVGGYGEAFVTHMSSLVGSYTVAIASEYSFLAIAYKFGLLFVGLMIALMLRGPVVASAATGKWSLALMAAMLVVYFSTFNAFHGIPDSYLAVSLYVLVVNLITPKKVDVTHE